MDAQALDAGEALALSPWVRVAGSDAMHWGGDPRSISWDIETLI